MPGLSNLFSAKESQALQDDAKGEAGDDAAISSFAEDSRPDPLLGVDDGGMGHVDGPDPIA